jgi:hypothetical protein
MADGERSNGDFRSKWMYFCEIIPVGTCLEETLIRVTGATIDADDKPN